jgi:hypothetical protein
MYYLLKILHSLSLRTEKLVPKQTPHRYDAAPHNIAVQCVHAYVMTLNNKILIAVEVPEPCTSSDLVRGSLLTGRIPPTKLRDGATTGSLKTRKGTRETCIQIFLSSILIATI